jgi:hypothetical protein
MNKIPGSSFAPAVARKRVLLVDGYATKRDLRSKIMRKLGVDVDCASDSPSTWRDRPPLTTACLPRRPMSTAPGVKW